jgi:hypothetical protein
MSRKLQDRRVVSSPAGVEKLEQVEELQSVATLVDN